MSSGQGKTSGSFALASDQFSTNKFTACSETMNRMIQGCKGIPIPDDIAQNAAVAEFCSSNGTDPEKLLALLSQMAKKAVVDPKMIGENVGIMIYNAALLEYNLKQTHSAMVRLEPLFDCINIYLVLGKQHCSVVQNAKKVLSFLQDYFDYLKKNPTLSSSEKKNSKKGNKKTSGEASKNSTPGQKRFSPKIDPKEFNYRFHLYRTKFSLFNNMLSQATREIKVCMGVSNQSAHPMFLKSNLENLKRNFDKSVKILNAIQDDKSDPTLPALYFNNIGCIHFQLKKYEAAGYYFARAITENETIYGSDTQREVKLQTFARDRRAEILYNNGLLHLLAGKPEVAFDCFQGSSLVYYKDPRLWLRLAECCVSAHAKIIEEKRESHHMVTPITITNEILPGNEVGETTKLVLQSQPEEGLAICEKDAPNTNFIFSGSPFGNLSLAYAEKCLRSCLYLCRRLLSEFPDSDEDGDKDCPSLTLQVTKDDLDTIRQAALTNLAFVCLSTNNPKVAITCANNLLLSNQDDRQAYSLFTHLYAAEAYCMLDKPGDALIHIPIEKIETYAEFPVPSDSPYFQPYPDAVKYSFYHNRVVTHILRGEFDHAQQLFRKALLTCPPQFLSTAILLQVYLELQNGRTSTALALLRKGRPHATSSSHVIGKRQE